MFLVVRVARQGDPYFKALHDKKRAEGNPYTVAVCVMVRKLTVRNASSVVEWGGL